MKTDSKKNKIVLRLDGKIPHTQFKRAVDNFFKLINNVSNDITNQKQAFELLVEVREGSAEVHGFLEPTQKSFEPFVPSIIDSINNGIRSLENKNVARPPHFNDAAMKAVKELGIVNQSGITVDLIANEIQSISLKSITTVDSFMSGHYTDFGSIEGSLDVVSLRGRGNSFRIYDALTDYEIKCHFKDEILDLVGKALVSKTKTSVWGEITYRLDGQPISINVENLEIFLSDEMLPSFESMVGIFGGKN